MSMKLLGLCFIFFVRLKSGLAGVFYLAKIYAFMYVKIRNIFGIRIPGLGRILRTLKKPRTININGINLFFSPEIAPEYGIHLLGLWQEPETHLFLKKLRNDLLDKKGQFIDVGSNIGIFLLDMGVNSNFHVIGFEPSNKCIEATQKSLQLNGILDYELHNVLVGAEQKFVPFEIQNNIEGASIYSSPESAETMEVISLDSKLLGNCERSSPTIILIDVEGYELEVLKGAKNFIERHSPLIIFEYNHVSKEHFNIAEIQFVLGSDYEIHRLRKDAMLDSNLIDTWNCVAFKKTSYFGDLCGKYVIKLDS